MTTNNTDAFASALQRALKTTDSPRVVVSGNHAVPWTALAALDAELASYRLHGLNIPKGIPDREGVEYETAFVGGGMRRHPRLKYYPARLSQVPLLYKRSLPVDVVVAHTSRPIDGKVSLGCEVNVLPAAIEACKARGGVVIAQMNSTMPYTYGDGELDLDVFDAVIEVDDPIANTATGAAVDPVRAESAATIGGLVAGRVEDGMTLQLGIGEIPDATLLGVLDKRKLGIWSEMVSDGILALTSAGALDTDRIIVCSFMFGRQELFEWAHLNENLRVLRTETVNAPAEISRNPGMTSINTALQVDLFDQANASRINARIFSGFGGQTDFTVGAIHAPGGQAIMALRSWHPKADVSTIVPLLDEPVTSFQHSCVITENGIAELIGHDDDSQAHNLIENAAHPDVREELWEEAHALGLC
ncbi:MAG: acetyl-CoA hydrolase/transferase C-terminal domain-containing protein [Mobilicoccus sp.]|nr:acetyl-CoA hydrolase/transferase C-terminal domain-containing protein [Mobilicoccus sp.]